MWDIIETDFGDETANFGPRKESGIALYQIDTIATVSCREENNKVFPNAVSSVLGDLTSLAIDTNLIVQSSSLLGFDHVIDEIEWSPDGSLIIVGVASGLLYILSAESTEIVFSVNLVPEERRVNGRSFRKILFAGCSDLVILTADGQLIVQRDIEIFKQEGGDIGEAVKEKINMCSTKEVHTSVNDMFINGNFIYTVGTGQSIIGKWNMTTSKISLVDEHPSILTNDAELMKASGTTDGHYLFTLDANHHVSLWAADMLVCLGRYDDLEVDDICLLETSTSRNKRLEGMKCVLITRPTDRLCHLLVKSLPSWETVYDLQLVAPSYLAKCNTMQDAIYITEYCENTEKPGTITTVRFRCLNETDPKTRLYRILQKNKFEEAEKFANLFQLDIELVHKVKANYLVDQLSPWNASKYSETELAQMVTQLFNCLDTVIDNLHAAENCMTAALPQFADTEALLTYCQKRLEKVASSKDQVVRDKHQLCKGKLLEIQQKLITFHLAYGEENFSGQKWEEFMRTSLLQEALLCLDRGQVDTGFIIWSRHQAEWSSSNILTVELIQNVLSIIPDRSRPSELLGYLSTALIPVVVREIPEALESIVSFVIDKTKFMEITDKPNWPGSAIQFCDFIYHRLLDVTSVMLDDETCMASENANKTRMNSDTVLQPLLNLLVTLRQLDEVLNKYKCPFSLAQFMQETTETIVFRMLDKVVSLELIVPTLERQIRPYMKKHDLLQDQIFSKYIKDLLQRYGQIRCYTGEVAWETKAAAIIDCITDIEQKIEGILEVMKWASIPWSSEVDHLVQMGLNLKHSKVSKLRIQCDRVKVRKVLMKYGCNITTVPQGKEAERLMYVMLTKDQEGCMEDALQVMELCKVQHVKPALYYFRMRQLISSDRIEECLDLLRSLPVDVGLQTGLDIVTLTFVKLNDMVVIQGLEEQIHTERRLYAEVAIYIIKYLQLHIRDPIELQDLKEMNTLLASLLPLQVEFDMYVNVDDFHNEDYRLDLIFSYIKKCFVDSNQSQSGYAKVYRLAALLQIPHTSIQGQMAIKLAIAGDIQRAVHICGELFESSPSDETASTLYEVVKAFLHLMTNVNEDVDINKLRLLPDICHRLACQAVCISPPDKLYQYLELSKTCSLLLSVSQQCESGDSTLSEEWGETAGYCVSKDLEMMEDYDMFEKDALIMESVTILPLVCHYALLNPLLDIGQEKSQANEGGDAAFPVTSLCQGVFPVIQHLRENRHSLLAFDFSQHMLNTLHQYIQQQDMGLPFSSQSEKERVEKCLEAEQSICKSSQAMLKDLTFNIVMKVFNSSREDSQLAFTFLSTRPKNEVVDIMLRLVKMAGQQYKKLKKIAGMGIALGHILPHPDLVSKCELLEVNACWGYRLKKLKIPFKDVFMGPTSEKKKLLPLIAQNDRADTDLIKDFCQAFGLDKEEGLLLYLDHLFTPHEEVIPDVKTNKHVLIEHARDAIDEIKNTDELQSRMKKIYYRVSSYDYETLEFLLNVMIEKQEDDGDIPVEKGLKLLEYLRVYTRHTQPSDYETNYKPGGDKKESQIFMTTLPPESKTRLPIHPLIQGDSWKIITAELKKENISTWILIAKLLNLSPDQICLTAVQNMVVGYTEMFTSPDAGSDMSQWNWRPEQANLTLLQDANQVLNNIENCENSLACAKWMVNKLPLGAEKVLVLQQCIKLAELWHISIPEEVGKKEKAKAVYLKFLALWQKMATAQALCLHGLGEAELLQNTDKPQALVQKLYEHQSITQTHWDTGAVKPDVHGAAVKIAEVNKISLEQIQASLMEKWLQTSSSLQQDSDATMTFSLDNLKFTDVPAEQENDEETIFKRVVYLVQKGDKEANIYLLLSFAFKPKEVQDTITCIRAMRCLLHLCAEDEETLKTMSSNKSLDDIRNLLHIMIYLASLEKLHIRHTVETFQACQKEGLIRGIWKNHSHEKTAVTLVSCFCLDYNFYDPQIWNVVLLRLQSFGLMRQLEYVLLRLNKVPELWQIPAFSKVWQAVVSSPLQKACAPLTREQINKCVHYFNILISCPVLKEIEMEKVSKMYEKLELPACALGCLVLGQSHGDTHIQTFLQQNEGKTLLDSMEELQHNGFNHAIALKLEELVYKEVLRSGQLDQVMDSGHQKSFVSHCIHNKTVDQLLVFAVKHNKLPEAKALFSMYSATYPDILLKLNKYIDDDDEDEDSNLVMLKAYLKMQNLTEAAAIM